MQLDILQKKSGDFLGQGYTEESVLVKDLSEQIAKAKDLRKESWRERAIRDWQAWVFPRQTRAGKVGCRLMEPPD